MKEFHSHKFSAVSDQAFPGETKAEITAEAMSGTSRPVAIAPAFICSAWHLELRRRDRCSRDKSEQGRGQSNTFASAVLRYGARSGSSQRCSHEEVVVLKGGGQAQFQLTLC